jgi:hypothetical protein
MARRNFCSAFKNFITDRTSQSAGAGIRASIFNSLNDATVRTQEVPLGHAPCYIIALSHMRSHFAQYKVWLAVGRVRNLLCGRASYRGDQSVLFTIACYVYLVILLHSNFWSDLHL